MSGFVLPLHIPCDTINIEKYCGFIPLLFLLMYDVMTK